MADPLQHVNPNDPLVIRAATWNAFVDAARETKKGPRIGAGPNERLPLVPSVEVYVKNTTGGTLAEWSVVTPTGYATDPDSEPIEARKRPVFEVSAPVATDDLILLTVEPIANGRIGRAVATGIAVAVVNVTDAAHRFAVPIIGNLFQLNSATCGPARLSVPAAVGTEKRLVVLGAPPCDAEELVAAPCSTACGSLGSLATDACLRLELVCATGSFSAIDADQFAGVFAFGVAGVWTFVKWDEDTEDWVTFDLVWFTNGVDVTLSGPVVFTWNATPLPTLTLDGITLTLRCLEADGTFAAHPRNGVTGDPEWVPEGDCPDNEFILRVSCTCCPPDGYTGPGYYPTYETTCGVGDCLAVELTDDSICTFEGVICGPRFDTLEEAEDYCDPGTFPTCGVAPAGMSYSVVNAGGCLDGHTDTLSETVSNTTWADNNTPSPCSTDTGFVLQCAGDTWTATYDGAALTLVSQTATTLVFEYTPVAPVTGALATFTVSV